MWLAVVRLDLLVPGSRSLKDRRQAVGSLKERLKHRYEAACAEVGDHDSWNRASLGLVVVANEKKVLQELVSDVIRYAQNDPHIQLAGAEKDFLSYADSH